MVKKWIILTLSAVLALSLGGCSSDSGNNDAPTDSKGTTGAKTKIIYWTPDRHDADFMKAKVDKFNQTNRDNIEVEMNVMGDNYPQAVDISFASKQAPDVLQVNDFQTYYKKGYLAPINSYMSDEMKATFKDSLIENKNTIDGKIFTLPNTGQIWRLIYNKDIFKKAGIATPPTTLADMVVAYQKDYRGRQKRRYLRLCQSVQERKRLLAGGEYDCRRQQQYRHRRLQLQNRPV